MAVSNLVQFPSLALNRIMFGARIENDRDFNSQLNTIFSAYVGNLLLVLAPVVIFFIVSGRYDPLHVPFDEPALRTMLAIANPTTFVFMLLASLSWVMHDEAIERALAARQNRGRFSRAVSLLFVPSLILNAAFCIIFFAAAFRFLDFGAFIASIFCNCLLLLALFGRRSWKRKT